MTVVATNAAPQRVEHQMTDKGYVPLYATGVVEQPWSSYTRTDHEVWATLFQRQQQLLVGRASTEFLRSQRDMGMSADQIPSSTTSTVCCAQPPAGRSSASKACCRSWCFSSISPTAVSR